jgi:hypothetical protein
MMPDEKRNMMTAIDSHGGVFSVDMCKALCTECSIPFKEVYPILMCYNLANKHPEHLDMTLSTLNHQEDEHSDIFMAKAWSNIRVEFILAQAQWSYW